VRVAFATLGCRLNQFETDALVRAAAEDGHEVVEFADAADLYVVNSCTITHDADADTRQLVRRAARQTPGARIVVTGCMANSDPDALAAMPEVSRVLGNREKERFFDLALGSGEERVHVAATDLTRRLRITRLRPAADPRRSRAYLKIQDGCDYRCSFCIVPQVRGRSSSLPHADACAQLQELVAAGVPEVVLTGVHLGTYGRDLQPRIDLVALLEDLLTHLGPAHLRLGSVDPHEVGPALIDLLARDRRLCRHLHLPVQSGDDTVLRAMRRAHTSADLRDLVPRLVAAVPGIHIGTDVIAGFPGERASQFEATLELLRELPLASLHVFSYSEREGTAAIDLPDPVPPAERFARTRILRDLSTARNLEFRRDQLGTRCPAVVYRARERRGGRLVALTDNYIKVELDGPDALLGRAIQVELDAVDGPRTRARLRE
jgi:threonylcarbamoyladenosine tRNA methylthiotransferase MtaB